MRIGNEINITPGGEVQLLLRINFHFHPVVYLTCPLAESIIDLPEAGKLFEPKKASGRITMYRKQESYG